MTHEEALELIEAELKHANEKHGEHFANLIEMYIALCEEVAEVSQAIVKGDINGEHGVKRELAQVAAVCIKALGGCVGIEMSKKPCRFCESVDIKIKAVNGELPSAVCQSCGVTSGCCVFQGFWGLRR